MSWLTEWFGTAPTHTAAPVREDTSGLIAALNAEEAANTPSVRDKAFSAAASRGLGDSPYAQIKVGEALSKLGAEY